MKKTIYIIGVISILIISSISVANTTQSNIIYVDDDEGADYTRIQDVMFNRFDKNSYTQEYKEYIIQEINKNNHSYDTDAQQYIPTNVGVLDDNGPMDSPWSSFSYNNQNTGQSPYNTRDNPMDLLWTFEADYLGFDSSPVIDQDGILYIGARDHYLYAINPDGSLHWRYNINDWASDSAALAEDGTIYVGSMDDYLYAINPDGTLKWRFDGGESIFGSPKIGLDGTIYFGMVGSSPGIGHVYALNPDGTEKWHIEVGDYVYNIPALAEDGTIYVTSNDRYLYALHPDDGSVLWKFRTGDGMGSPSVGSDGTIYGASWDNHLYAINPDGTLKWKTVIDFGSYSTPTIGNDGTIYIGGKYFYAVNADGNIKWTYQGWESNEYQCSSSAYAISADGIIYFVATKMSGHGGDLFALNNDGTLHFRETIAPIDDQFASPVIGEDGTVYIGSEFFESSTDGYFYAFGTSNENHPPDKPVIDGSTSGETGVEYQYIFSVSDLDNDDVYLLVEWGDNSDTGWIGPNSSGDDITVSHSWDNRRKYSISAKTMDEHDLESEWSTLQVTMPKYKFSLFLYELFQSFKLDIHN